MENEGVPFLPVRLFALGVARIVHCSGVCCTHVHVGLMARTGGPLVHLVTHLVASGFKHGVVRDREVVTIGIYLA